MLINNAKIILAQSSNYEKDKNNHQNNNMYDCQNAANTMDTLCHPALSFFRTMNVISDNILDPLLLRYQMQAH